MTRTILITGATDGIGLEAAKLFAAKGHTLLLHGRNPAKLKAVQALLPGEAEAFTADFSAPDQVRHMADEIARTHDHIDVLINNAGILASSDPITPDGYDVRFAVNTLAPFILTKRLLPLIPKDGRIINLSSAAQAPVDIGAMTSGARMSDMDAYSQSKLAITMWSMELAQDLPEGPVVVAVNPGSLLATNMVKEGFGIAGNDIGIGADILYRAALSDEFADASGKYFDNDAGRFGTPHPDALDARKSSEIVRAIGALLQ